jgi:hypothetical protein
LQIGTLPSILKPSPWHLYAHYPPPFTNNFGGICMICSTIGSLVREKIGGADQNAFSIRVDGGNFIRCFHIFKFVFGPFIHRSEVHILEAVDRTRERRGIGRIEKMRRRVLVKATSGVSFSHTKHTNRPKQLLSNRTHKHTHKRQLHWLLWWQMDKREESEMQKSKQT